MIHNEKQTIKEEILSRIREGKTAMVPRWRFVVRAVLMAMGAIVSALVILFVISFVVFAIRQTRVSFLPAFGSRGVGLFLTSLPWLLILLALLFIAVFEILIRRYAFAYRRPMLFSLVGVLLLMAGGTAIISLSRFHESLFEYAQNKQLPLAGPLYRGFGGEQFNHLYPGTIVELTDSGFILAEPNKSTTTIIVTPETRFPTGIDFVQGDSVVVLGDSDNTTEGVIFAFGVQRVDRVLRLKPHIPNWRRFDASSSIVK